ncbi:MAG: Gfo/Idh/MocA family oxidoreductase, partial [Lentisphaeria bacterium]|nr:Gfo/Idh/MocA family oxidoreductase [Lentisphaeria bacterium]
MSTKIRWGLLAAGNIAHAFAAGVQHCELGVLHAVGSRDLDRSNAFADEFDIPQRYGSYDELLADPDVDAVYISTLHPQHAEWAIKTAEAGKHMLCEKPLAMNAADAAAIIDAAQRHDVFLMEAFMYRCNPQTARLVELLREKSIGEVRMIRASFGFNVGDNYEGRAVAYEH